MTTKPPSPIASFPESSLESKAYAAAHAVPGREPNDVHRLGYSIWAWLKERKGSLEEAVMNSGVRTELPAAEITARVREELRKSGIEL